MINEPCIFIVTRRDDVTADYVILELKKRGTPYFRFNTDTFPISTNLTWSNQSDVPSLFTTKGNSVSLESIRSVWYRRTAAPDTSSISSNFHDYVIRESREALEWLWRTLDAEWVSHPDAIRKAEGKMHQMELARRHGIRTPSTLITNDPKSAEEFRLNHKGNVVVKALREKIVEVEGERRAIFTSYLSGSPLERAAEFQAAPLILQECIKKFSDIRVTVIGDKVFATEIKSQAQELTSLDWRRGDVGKLTHLRHELPIQIEEFCLMFLNHHSLKFGAFDFVLTPSRDYVFLELNPNGQWAWIEPLTQQPLRAAFVNLLEWPLKEA